jgi:hypothetical protein
MPSGLETWNLGPNAGLNQRGFALEGEASVLEADNLSYLSEAFISMRNAFSDEDLTGAGFTGEVQWIGRHVTNDGVEELWAAAYNAGTVACARRVAGVWSAVTLIDTPDPDSLTEMHSVTFNGKLFLAYNSAVNRLHVWDGTAVRRVGLIVSGVGSVANTGAGAYAATARRYRFSQRIKDGTDIVAESELSAAVSFTPSGAGTAARITKPTTVDSATHWVVYGLISSAGDTYDLYEELAETANATTTYDDSTAPASYSGDAPPVLASNIPPPSAKCLATDSSRLILGGAWETSATAGQTTPANNRVWFTRALASTDVGDDESVPNGLWLNIGDAGPVTALGTIYTDVYAFKAGSVHKLIPTQDPDGPFSRVLISENFGAVGQRVIANGETEDGFSAIYFADDHAVYRLAYGAVLPFSEPVGRDMRAQSITADGSVLAYDPYRRVLVIQISNDATGVLGSYSAFTSDTVKKRWAGFSLGGATSGWTLGTSMLATDTILAGLNATLRGAVVATAADGSSLQLYVCGKDDNGLSLIRSWGPRNVLDGDIPFTSKVRARRSFGPGKYATVYPPILYYRNPQGDVSGTLSCTVSYVKNYDEETITQTFTLDTTQDDNGITVKRQKLESLQMGNADVLDLTVSLTYTPTVAGTAYDSVATPTIDAIAVPYKTQERQ